MGSNRQALFALAVLFAINFLNFYDRMIGGALHEPVKKAFDLSDKQMGAVTMGFTLLYAFIGVPLGWWADIGRRTRILSIGVFFWSLLTAASGLAWNFASLFGIRLGVGVGEATCAPAANSLIGDLFPPAARARALSVFMLGLPIGNSLAYPISGLLTHHFSWRAAFYVALIPGVLCSLLVLAIPEPARGGTEHHAIGSRKREGSPFLLVLSIPTMWWIIISGALQNFNMYAIGQFMSAFVQRYHGWELVPASYVAMAVYGLSGIPGLLLGGMLGDIALHRRSNGRLLVGTAAIAISAPLAYFALSSPSGQVLPFGLMMGVSVGLMYVYYSTVYSSIQDVIEPSLRGTALALYFFAMYTLGGSLGPFLTGTASDYFREAAIAKGMSPEQAAATGLHNAMYIIPALTAALAVVLFAASRTVGKDAAKLQAWMKTVSPVAK